LVIAFLNKKSIKKINFFKNLKKLKKIFFEKIDFLNFKFFYIPYARHYNPLDAACARRLKPGLALRFVCKGLYYVRAMGARTVVRNVITNQKKLIFFFFL
jgi:hypothetical protein